MEPGKTDLSNLRRAYRELLIGDDYNDSLQPHLHLTEVATQWGGAFDSLWQWQVISVGLTVKDLPPNTYMPMLFTDVASAYIPERSYGHPTPPVSERIADFVSMVGASHVVFCRSVSAAPNTESFLLQGTDGHTAREASWLVEYKAHGRSVTPMRRAEAAGSYQEMPITSDPTTEFDVADNEVLGRIALALRKTRATDNSRESAVQIVRERYARGEISREEYHALIENLTGVVNPQNVISVPMGDVDPVGLPVEPQDPIAMAAAYGVELPLLARGIAERFKSAATEGPAHEGVWVVKKEQWLDVCRIEFFTAAGVVDERSEGALIAMGTALDNGTEWDDAQPIVQNVLRVVEEERGLTPVIEWLRSATMTNDVNKAIRS